MRIAKLLSLLSLCALIGLYSCKSKTPKELIVNKWKIKDMTGAMLGHMPDSVKANLLKTASIEFKSDNSYAMTGGGQGVQKGTYSVSEDGKTVTTTPDLTHQPQVNNINELTEHKLVVTDKFGTKVVCADK